MDPVLHHLMYKLDILQGLAYSQVRVSKIVFLVTTTYSNWLYDLIVNSRLAQETWCNLIEKILLATRGLKL